MPEARAYFESLEIGDELLSGVEELCMDGGNRVYQECAPVWDGEDDLFGIASLDDLALLPNLRRVLGAEFLGPDLADVLERRGITADQDVTERPSPMVNRTSLTITGPPAACTICSIRRWSPGSADASTTSRRCGTFRTDRPATCTCYGKPTSCPAASASCSYSRRSTRPRDREFLTLGVHLGQLLGKLVQLSPATCDLLQRRHAFPSPTARRPQGTVGAPPNISRPKPRTPIRDVSDDPHSSLPPSTSTSTPPATHAGTADQDGFRLYRSQCGIPDVVWWPIVKPHHGRRHRPGPGRSSGNRRDRHDPESTGMTGTPQIAT
ncbi:DUF6892 domain-containing protein [Streptomyces sp. NPDC085927]|uniref:DUF6892 domain-containing protein n=1 Tax=Streptomyces sp. NPDC085927 TaxID=3365738 RepID=UPI0037D202CA